MHVLGPLGLVLVLLASFGALVLRRRSLPPAAEADFAWLEEFSVTQYRPMEGLLESSESAWLRRQPGYTHALGRRFRRSRLRVFYLYLAQLTRDFARLQRIAAAKLAGSPQSDAEFAFFLFQQDALFRLALCAVYGRMLLFSLHCGSLDARPLLDAVRAMEVTVRRLHPAPQIA